MRMTKIHDDKDKNIEIEYKKMSNYKDKSILLVKDIGREEHLEESMKALMELFEKYNQLFTVIEGIKGISEKLSNYGYDPQ